MFVEIQLPYKGKSLGLPVSKENNQYSGYILNVRPRDVQEKRMRLGKRFGMKKWGAETQIGSAEQPVVALCSISAVR